MSRSPPSGRQRVKEQFQSLANIFFFLEKKLLASWISSSSEKLSSPKFEGCKLRQIALEIFENFCHTSSGTMFSSLGLDQKSTFRSQKRYFLFLRAQASYPHENLRE